MRGTVTITCYSSSVVVRALVLDFCVACVEHSQVRHGEAREERGHHALRNCIDVNGHGYSALGFTRDAFFVVNMVENCFYQGLAGCRN